ncbi:hypothetical protein FG386_002871 [Cryptosporidium ryanae]|uniref:uncharacterized protein n=1 Tax=Cryptosporidium ryanae TaxID=515981 RepID=UPI003519FD89|nr:hypothetical protein FG386_002871 [Cryptosporidium ryanae]
MKTAFYGEYKLQDNYLDVLSGQSSTLANDVVFEGSGISLSEIFEIVSSVTVSTGLSHSLFGISDAKTALTVSYFIGLGSFIGFIILIALFRGIYLLIRNKRRNRNTGSYTVGPRDFGRREPNVNTYTVKSNSSMYNNDNIYNSADYNI